MEQNLIGDAVLEFNRNGTTLDRNCVRKLARVLVYTLSMKRRKMIGLQNDLPCKKWLFNFIARKGDLTIKRRMNLENLRHEAMNPEIVANYFVLLESFIRNATPGIQLEYSTWISLDYPSEE